MRAPNRIRVSRPNDPPPPPPLLRGGVGVAGGVEGVELPGVGPEVTAGAQATVPADAGAVLVARVGSIRTSAVSARPWSSVTVRRSVTVSTAGASSDAFDVLAPEIAGGLVVGETTVHAKLLRVRPQAAVDPVAARMTFWPGDTLAGRETAAIGRSAALT